ncbi:uncharacterized protein [Haliotis cracherodii]|uniref:uncharacterized protein n=1 Tax=Haliotis cracherodii TaxID=6455 RepID=UPI0039E7448A
METESCTSETLDTRSIFTPVPHFDLNNVTPDKKTDSPHRGCPVPFSKTQDSNTPSTSQRSPAHVRFGTCGLRSDTYLRHALSSPYHKTASMMAVQTDCSSPLLFKTPIRNTGSTPSSSRAKTPSGSRLHPGVTNHLTPQSHVISNPFDMTGDRVHFPGFSPGLFTVMSTPAGEDGKTFRWSIEHIAALNPANIEDMPEQHDHGLDREAEERAQQAISHYFASQLIVPSPWNAPERKYISPCTPVTQSGAHRPMQIFPEDLQGSIQKELNKLRKSQEVSCQTTLSLPVDFDMQSVLGEYMNAEATEETNQEALSTSSLRRKLFFQGETSTALSPVKSETKLLEESPPSSPLAQTTPEWDKQTYRTSSSGQFSSSPIKGPSEPFFRRTSSEADFLASPELSPINKKRSNRGAFCRSSGCGVPNVEESFSFNCNTKRRLSPLPMPDMSPIGCDPDDEYDIKRQLSPLPMPDMSPISCDPKDRGDVRQRLSPLPMPDMSPISCESGEGSGSHRRPSPLSVPNMSPICQIARETLDEQHQLPDVSPITFKPASEEGDNLGASYLPEPRSEHLADESSTPQAEDCRQLNRIPSLGATDPATRGPVMAFRKSIAMETDSSSQDGFYFQVDNKTYTFNYGQDISIDDMDTTSDYAPQPSSANQDTGYQTASLQMTNHDTGLHTNLTSQFSSLPFKSESSIDQNELEDSVTSKDCPRVCSDFDQPSDSDLLQSDSGLAEDRVLERARKILARTSNQCPTQTCELDNSVSQSASLPIQPISSSTPTKRCRRRIERKIAVIDKPSKGNCQLASDVATELLKRAGEDLAKYCPEAKPMSAS